MCKRFGFDYIEKCYQHKAKIDLENKNHKVLWDFDTQTDYTVQAKRSNMIIVNKEKKRACQIEDVVMPARYIVKMKESEKLEKYQSFARELKRYEI